MNNSVLISSKMMCNTQTVAQILQKQRFLNQTLQSLVEPGATEEEEQQLDAVLGSEVKLYSNYFGFVLKQNTST
jgi:hypothetical protein